MRHELGIDRRSLIAGGLTLGAMAGIPANAKGAIGSPQQTFDAVAKQLGIIGAGAGIGGIADRSFVTGLASIPFNVPVTADTLFHIGSNGKHITAVAILRLVDQGKLRLDSRIGDVVEGLPPAWRDRRIASLLSHTAGLPEYDRFEWDRIYDHAGFLALFDNSAPAFVQGTSWAYSNTNYVMLGWAIEAITGKSYRRVIDEDVLGPLDLPHARVDDAASPIVGRAEPYDLRPGSPRHAIRMSGDISGWPDGGVLFSTRDWPRWDRALAAGPLLSDAMRTAMVAPTRLSTGRTIPYGFGLFVDPVRGMARQWHGGSVPGFTSYLARSPHDGMSLLLMTNGSFATSAVVRHLGNSLLERVRPGSSLLSLPVMRDPHPRLTREALAILARGTASLDPHRFAPELQVAMARSGARDSVPTFLDDRTPQRFDLVEEYGNGSQLMRRYRLTYAERADHMLFGYDKDERLFWTFFN